MRLMIPRDYWIRLLTEMKKCNIEVFEIQTWGIRENRFSGAVNHIKSARIKIEQGNYNEAILICRKAIECIYHEVSEEILPEEIIARTDDKRAKEYMSFITRIKQLASYAVHDVKISVEYTRFEAQFVVRSTENLIALLNSLLY